jgi:hypothetical protein
MVLPIPLVLSLDPRPNGALLVPPTPNGVILFVEITNCTERKEEKKSEKNSD